MQLKTTFILLLLSYLSFSQDCEITTGKVVVHDDLKHSILQGEEGYNQLHIKTGIGPDGSMDSRTYAPLIYSSNIWAGGTDPNGSLKLAAGMYDVQDWSPGPLDDNGQVDHELCGYWDQVFSFTKEEVLKARDIIEAGEPCETMPESILNWPAKGNPFIQDVNIEGSAEFYDTNLDGIYNPCDGDVPYVFTRKCTFYNFGAPYQNLPDNVAYYIMNDNAKEHTLTGAPAIQMDIGVYTFTINSPEAENIIFNKYVLQNKATDDFRDVQFSKWFDFDLGCPQDDYIGSDIESQMIFAYNENETDECQGESLGSSLPMIGSMVLSGEYTKLVIGYDKDGNLVLLPPAIGTSGGDTLVDLGVSSIVIPNNCQSQTLQTNCNPQNYVDYYRTLKAQYFDGSEITDQDGEPTKYMGEL